MALNPVFMRKYLFVLPILLLPQMVKSQSDIDILSSFCQGSANNCASIALIKAAMHRYGYNRILQSQPQGDIFNVTLRDGVKLKISQNELSLAKSYANFDTTGSFDLLGEAKDSILFHAYFAYAVIAKNISENGYWGCVDRNGHSPHFKRIKGFENALEFITRTSFCTDNCYKLLGLKIKNDSIYDYQENINLSEKGTILYSWGHAVVVYNNQLDCYGEWLPVSKRKVCHNKFAWYFILQ